MPGADLIDGIVGLWRALEAGDEARAYRLSLPISSLVSLEQKLWMRSWRSKNVGGAQGIVRNTLVRGPVGYRLDGKPRLEVDRLFDQIRELK